MTHLIVDLSDPGMQEACGDCKVGEERTFTNVTGKATAVTPNAVTFDVSDLEYAAPESETPAEDTAEGGSEAGESVPPAVQAAMSAPPA